MRRTLIAAALVVGLVMPAGAQDDHNVQCGGGWIFFYPYAPNTQVVGSNAMLIRESQIEQGWLAGNFGFGTLIMKPGYGWGMETNELTLSIEGYQQVMYCLMD